MFDKVKKDLTSHLEINFFKASLGIQDGLSEMLKIIIQTHKFLLSIKGTTN